jgi:hypothetical protein
MVEVARDLRRQDDVEQALGSQERRARRQRVEEAAGGTYTRRVKVAHQIEALPQHFVRMGADLLAAEARGVGGGEGLTGTGFLLLIWLRAGPWMTAQLSAESLSPFDAARQCVWGEP